MKTSWREELNLQSTHYKCVALPIELRQRAAKLGNDPKLHASKACVLPLHYFAIKNATAKSYFILTLNAEDILLSLPSHTVAAEQA